MSNEITPPILSKEDINSAAESFLAENNIEDSLPVPVEEIVEFKLGLDIIPFPGLQRDFDIDGFMSGDFTGIYVDDFIYNNRPARYRFTLAHEIGHIVLHKDIIALIRPVSVVEWPDLIVGLDGKNYSWLEYQAYEFAGRLLVPRKHLIKHFKEKLALIEDKIRMIKGRNIQKNEYQDYVVESIAKELIDTYDVSIEVLSKRINKEIESGHLAVP